MDKSDAKRILIAVPELSYSGSVFSSLRITKVLKDDYQVVVVSYENGSFQKEFERENIPVEIIDKNNIYENEDIKQWLRGFDLLIANTIIVYALADYAKNIIPTIWYIREAQNLGWQFFKYDYRRYYALKRADIIYAVSEYAADYINCINSNVSVLHNCVEDVLNNYTPQCSVHDKVKFLMLGTLEPRKAFDVAIDAFWLLPDKYREKAEFHLAGRVMGYAQKYADDLIERIDNTDGFFYHGEIQDRDKLMQMMADCDVVVVPSKDESCSLVALEAAMMGKALIVSENVGAKYILRNHSNYIFQTDVPESLVSVITECIGHPEKVKEVGGSIRGEYIRTSTFETYSQKIKEMVKNHLCTDKEDYYQKHMVIADAERKQRKEECDNYEPLYMFLRMPEKHEKIVLYGAGEAGFAFAKYCNENDIDFIWTDSDEKKWGNPLIDKTIVSPKEALSLGRKVYIAICSQTGSDEIKEKAKSIVSNISCIWVEPVLIRK